MKISWFTPLPPAHTEIGNVSARLLPQLSRTFDCHVYSETSDWDKNLEKHCPVYPLQSQLLDWKRLHLHGLPVYHIGNNVHYHGEIILAAKRCPGIIVLHDLALHETLLNVCLLKGSGRAGYFDILHKYGGQEATEAGRKYLDENQPDISELATVYPLFEYVLENAMGVISHNPLNVASILKATPAPVLYAPLPYLEKSMLKPQRNRRNRRHDPYRIIFFGFLGSANRRLKPFLEAFRDSPVKDRFRVILAGKYNDEKVTRWIHELGLSSLVELKGFLPEEALDQLLSEADLAINLRWPSMGESSATLLRIWNHSLPSMVTRTAFYASLPEDTVGFVDPENEKTSIQNHLQAFADNPTTYFESGRRGRELLESRHSIESFISNLEKFLPEVEKWGAHVYPQVFGRNLAAEHLADYPSPDAREGLLNRCAREIASWS